MAKPYYNAKYAAEIDDAKARWALELERRRLITEEHQTEAAAKKRPSNVKAYDAKGAEAETDTFTFNVLLGTERLSDIANQ